MTPLTFAFVWLCLTRAAEAGSCGPLQVTFCGTAGYTSSSSPSGVSGYSLRDIEQIVESACAPDVAALMCRAVVPECGAEEDTRLKPCRSLCERVKSECEAPLKAKGLYWPSRLSCDSLPQDNCVQGSAGGLTRTGAAACEPITIPLCKGLTYNLTVMPNMLGHRVQEEAALEVHQFFPLIEVGCSSALKPLLCSVYAPECVSGNARAPCRNLCESALAGCEPLMKQYGFSWPKSLKCEAFKNDDCETDSTDGLTDPGAAPCEPITIHYCSDLTYNLTVMPNVLGHKVQEDAGLALDTFYPLIQTGCSPVLKKLLCSVYVPQCINGNARAPCRRVCERVRAGCEPVINKFGFPWPKSLKCEAFKNDDCETEDEDTESSAEQILKRLNSGGFSVYGNGLTLRTADLLLAFADADRSEGLSSAEYSEMETFVASLRKEYVKLNQERAPPAVTQDQLMNVLIRGGLMAADMDMFKPLWRLYRNSEGTGIDFDNYVAAITRMRVLRARFETRLMDLSCDCQMASFSFIQFIKAAII